MEPHWEGKGMGNGLWAVTGFPMPWCSKFYSKEARNSEFRPGLPDYDIFLNIIIEYLSSLEDNTYFI